MFLLRTDYNFITKRKKKKIRQLTVSFQIQHLPSGEGQISDKKLILISKNLFLIFDLPQKNYYF